MAVLLYPSLIFLMVSVDINITKRERRAQELCEVEVAVMGPPSLIILMVSVDVKQH